MSLMPMTIVAAETHSGEPAVHPYVVGAVALAILLAMLVGLLMFGRDAITPDHDEFPDALSDRLGRVTELDHRSTSARRRVGVMGGTFDPVHHGHLVAASEVQAWFDLDEVVFVPTGQPWQKADRAVSAAEDRYLMTVIATASNPRFSVSRVDIDREGPTYTIDTLKDLHARLGEVDLFFITGVDALGDIFTWRDAGVLFELAHFVGCTRPGYEMDEKNLQGIPDDRVTIVEIPALAISSTDCRRRTARGEPVWYLVPDGVVQYIGKHALYALAAEPEPNLGRP